MRQFQDEAILSYLHNRLDVTKSVYDAIVYDSEVERRFAESLDKREDIELFVKLPSWFEVSTPVGSYNPDWAIVKKDDEKIYLIAETKGSTDVNQLRRVENDRIKCGKAHFKTMNIDFQTVTHANQVQ
jgi:type III restriction enzyme